MTYSDNNVVFFDSECVLCGNLIKLILRVDKRNKILFASLQSEYSRSILPREFVETSNYKSVAFLNDGKIYFYSDAVIRLFSLLGFPWSILKLGYLLPKKWRDSLYMKISNNRYSWFGKSTKCIIPDDHLKSKFVHDLEM